jgi:predicted transcriptional regulator
VRFPAETLERVRRLADADDRSVSSWIRRAVDHEVQTAEQSSGRLRTARSNNTSNARIAHP